jgi:hypothetical protein
MGCPELLQTPLWHQAGPFQRPLAFAPSEVYEGIMRTEGDIAPPGSHKKAHESTALAARTAGSVPRTLPRQKKQSSK